MLERYLKIGVFALLWAMTAVAVAAPQVSLQMTAEKEVVETGEEGEKVTRRVPAENAEPGQVVYYTIAYSNSGDEVARNVRLDNPVPEGAAYIADSAFGDGAEILFSVDGEVFKKPTNLTYQIKGNDGKTEKRKVSPEQYTTIRWVVEEIPAGDSGTAGFAVRVK